STPGGMRQTPVAAEAAARLVLFSDGRIGDTSDVVVQQANVEWVKIGDTTDNVGITALRARRSYEEPELLDVFVKAQNFGPGGVSTDVSLYVDGELSTVRSVQLGAYEPPRIETALAPDAATGEPGKVPAAQPDAEKNQPSTNVSSTSL